jgi:2-dehydropantoate 2-reductase
MKIAMMGSGGVGGYFGGRLAAKGYDVAFIARGAHLAAMRESGLVIESGFAPTHVKTVRATAEPAEIGPVDIVVVGVKLWATEETARAIKPLIGPDTAVISLQNGVDSEDTMAAAFGASHVMGGVAYIGTKIARPGVIAHTGTMQRLVFGELDGTRSPRAEALLAACLDAGITAEISPDIVKTIWQKFVFLVGLSGSTALTRSPLGSVRGDPDTRALLHNLMREVVAVGRAKGVALDADFADQQLVFADGLPATMTASMHHDLDAGNRLELPWLAGAVVRLGKALGVATPYNETVLAGLKPFVGGARPA